MTPSSSPSLAMFCRPFLLAVLSLTAVMLGCGGGSSSPGDAGADHFGADAAAGADGSAGHGGISGGGGGGAGGATVGAAGQGGQAGGAGGDDTGGLGGGAGDMATGGLGGDLGDTGAGGAAGSAGVAGGGGVGGVAGVAGGAGTAGGSSGATVECPPPPAPGNFPGAPTLMFVAGAQVSTLAGGGDPGTDDGQGSAARFDNPVSVTVAPSGDLFVADYDSGLLRRVTQAGAVTTVANLGALQPFGLVAASALRLFVDTDHNPDGQKTATTTGTIWSVDPSTGLKVVVKANVGRPRGVARLGDGRLVLGDYQNHVVRLLDPTSATITVLAGSGCPGFADGNGAAAAFNSPYGLTVTPDGKVVVADAGNGRIRLVDLSGNVTTLAGGDTLGTNDGSATSARFVRPVDVAVTAAGTLYVSDPGGHRIRRLDADGTVTTLAGDGTAGFMDGGGASAEFYGQEGLDVAPDGSAVFVADGTMGEAGAYHRIRKVDIPAAAR